MKKRVRIVLAAYAAFNLILVTVAGWMFAEANEKAKWGPPLRLDVPQYTNVGYMRMDSMTTDAYWPSQDYVEYEFLERIPNGLPEHKKDMIRVKRTVSETTPKDSVNDPQPEGVYKALYWFCEEDEYWYLICLPDPMVQGGFSPLVPGEERILEYSVPSAIVSRPGLYKIVMLGDLGSFDFKVQ